MSLLPHEIIVCSLTCSSDPRLLAKFEKYLSVEEQVRAARYSSTAARQHFIFSRGALRVFLAHHLAIKPQDVNLGVSPRGKPILLNNSDWHFNLTHKDGLCLLALGYQTPVGVDLEKLRPIQALAIAQRFFSEAEYHALKALEEPAQQAAFFQLWTAKEAVLKAQGDGIGRGKLAICQNPTLSETILYEDQCWYLHNLPMPPGYCATVASLFDSSPRYWHSLPITKDEQ